MLSKSLRSFSLALLSLGSVFAHPGEHHDSFSSSELLSARHAHDQLQTRSSHCGNHARAFMMERKAKRSLAKRELSDWFKRVESEKRDITASNGTAPHDNSIRNSTCVLAPEMTDGPYYIPGMHLRQNNTDGQVGIPMIMDIGVLDMASCRPVENAFVEVWHANSSGIYSGFSSASAAINDRPNRPNRGRALPNEVPESDTSLSAQPEDDLTFLRGIWPTTAEGVSEIHSNLPGYYVGRSIHTHVKVHLNVVQAENGTIATNRMVHTGQVYVSEEDVQAYLSLPPYNAFNDRPRTTNDVDRIYQTGISINQDWEFELMGDTLEQGVWAYTTLSVNSTGVGSGAAGNSNEVFGTTTTGAPLTSEDGSDLTSQDDTSAARRSLTLPFLL